MFVSVNVLAQHTSDTTAGEPTVLSIGSLNDSFNGAFGLNRDDYRSFGFDAVWRQQDHWFIKSEYSGMTNLNPDDSTDQGRLDELITYARVPFFNIGRIRISPALGFVLTGNLGGEGLQNGIHEDVGEPVYNVPYVHEELEFSPLFGITADNRIKLGDNESLFHMVNSIDFYSAAGYSNFLYASGKLYYGREYGSNVFVSAGFQVNDIHSNRVGKAVSEQETGFRFTLGQDISFFTLRYDIYPGTAFGYGRVGINLLKTNEKNTYKKEKLNVDFKAIFDRGGYYSNYKLKAFKIRELPVRMSLGHAYGTYTIDVIESHPEARGQYLQMMAGLESYFIPIKSRFQVNPYLGLGLGYKIESTFSGDNGNVETMHSTSLLTYADVGIRIGSYLPFLSRNTLLGLLIGDLITLPFEQENQQVLGQEIEFLTVRNDFYIGLNFIVDL